MRECEMGKRLLVLAALAALYLGAHSAERIGQDLNVDDLHANAVDFAKRYGLHHLNDPPAVDNRGKGLGELKGLRNFRSVLPGVLYRAGGNNAYRVPKLPNQGPLPPEALTNLCKQGFTRAVYLYRRGYEPQTTACQSKGQPQQTIYTQLTINGSKIKETQLLQLIRDQIVSQSPRPILVHCYNGYHESGYASAIALRQFCGFSTDQAYGYWERNAAKGVSFSAMKDRISRFTPKPELAISLTQRAAICPSP
jgi:hypothetical protein